MIQTVYGILIALLTPSFQPLVDSLQQSIGALATVDQVGLGLAGLFLLLGLWRGLWWQVIRFLGVVLSVTLARALSPELEPHVSGALDLEASVSFGLSWFLIFLTGLLVAALLGLLGKKALEAMQLGLMDRIAGGVLGVATGLSLHVALLVLLGGIGTRSWRAEHIEDTHSWHLLEWLAQSRIVMDQGAAETVLQSIHATPRQHPGPHPGPVPGQD